MAAMRRLLFQQSLAIFCLFLSSSQEWIPLEHLEINSIFSLNSYEFIHESSM